MRFIRLVPDLRLAIIVMVLVPLLVVFGGGGIVVLGALESRLEARLQEDISLIARTLKGPMARALDRDRERAMHHALRSAIDFGRVYGVYVYDAEGELLTRADRLRGGVEPETVFPEAEQLGRDEDVGDYRSMGGQDVFSYFTPLTDAGGQVIGMLQITRQVSEMRDYINGLLWQVILVLVVFSALFVVIVIAGHHVSLGRPVLRLGRTMERVMAGDNEVRAVPSGPKEIRRLGHRFNLMLDGISERDRRLGAQRKQQERLADKLRQSEKYALAGRLAGGVAHELGTPLSVIDGHIQRLLREQRHGSTLRDTLSRMQEATGRMAEVIQHLLGFGRGGSAPMRDVSVDRLVRLAAADARIPFETSGTTLEVQEGVADAVIRADESRLREALTHLLRNAMYAAQGGRVSIGWTLESDKLQISVEDSGPGVNADDRGRIFEPFFTTKKPGDGSGLGLAVVRGIIAAHDGDIDVSDGSLGGAAFRITLPLADKER